MLKRLWDVTQIDDGGDIFYILKYETVNSSKEIVDCKEIEMDSDEFQRLKKAVNRHK